MVDLRQLEKMLQRAEGPDPKLDEVIHAMMPEPKVVVPPRYTRSIDDAVTFVEAMIPKAFWCVENLDLYWCSVGGPYGPMMRETLCEGTTGGIGLCRSTVKAMLLSTREAG